MPVAEDIYSAETKRVDAGIAMQLKAQFRSEVYIKYPSKPSIRCSKVCHYKARNADYKPLMPLKSGTQRGDWPIRKPEFLIAFVE
jgi:hypothetical protein